MGEVGSGSMGGAGATIASSPSIGAENSSGFSSHSLSMFKSINSQPKDVIDMNFGKEQKSEFARSESFEKKVSDERSMFDISKPIVQDKIQSFDTPRPNNDQKSHEEKLTSMFGEKLDLRKNSEPSWQNPNINYSYLFYADFKPESEINEAQTEPKELEVNKPEIIDRTEEHQPKAAQQNSVVELKTSLEDTKTQTHEKENQKPSTQALETEKMEKKVQNHEIIKPATIEPIAKPQPEVVSPKVQLERTAQTIESIRNQIRLKPDTEEITISLPQTLPATQTLSPEVSKVMTAEALTEMIRTSSLAKTETATQTQQETETKTETANKTRKEHQTQIEKSNQTQQKEKGEPPKITIKKAWFERDVGTNKNRKWEIVKAYISVHYSWMRHYITKVDGVELAATIRKTRNEEKMESTSIKRIETDGSINPYSEVMENIDEIETFEDLEKHIEDAEKEFGATNFTSHPSQEIVDGREISTVHNNKEKFYANLDGEEVTVIMKGGYSIQKPEFVKVEME